MVRTSPPYQRLKSSNRLPGSGGPNLQKPGSEAQKPPRILGGFEECRVTKQLQAAGEL